MDGKIGASPVVMLGKSGAAFASPEGSVSEISNGWYYIDLTVNDTNTIGDLGYKITGTGADPTDFIDQIDYFTIFEEDLDLESINGLTFASTQIFGPSITFVVTAGNSHSILATFQPIITFTTNVNIISNSDGIFEPQSNFNSTAGFILGPNNVIELATGLDGIASITFFGGTGFFFLLTLNATTDIGLVNTMKMYPIIRYVVHQWIIIFEGEVI